jgi:hypothetical protein
VCDRLLHRSIGQRTRYLRVDLRTESSFWRHFESRRNAPSKSLEEKSNGLRIGRHQARSREKERRPECDLLCPVWRRGTHCGLRRMWQIDLQLLLPCCLRDQCLPGAMLLLLIKPIDTPMPSDRWLRQP